MQKIKVLSSEIAEKISAGEVVERPASVVKELVENSIDAGATRITVETKGGGISYIRVTDNGCGIGKEDMPTAFLRHATSKINSSSDLFSILTLGFRGEALAAIGAVSRVLVISCERGVPCGTQARFEGGRMLDMADAGCPEGTSVIVRDIFFNTPARLKFMKKDLVERELIAKVLEKLAMSHPEISFSFIRDGQTALQTSGDGNFKNVLYRIYGKEVFDSLLETDYEYNGVRVCGYVSKPVYARHNKGMQQFFLNRRAVTLKTASYALDEAYRDSIMTKKYPAAFLHITIDPSEVDVNVHPSKQEVKFGNEKQIYDAVFYAVKSALNCDMKRPLADRAVMPALRESRINTPFGAARINSPVSCDTTEKREELTNLILSDVFQMKYDRADDPTHAPVAEKNTGGVLKQGDYIAFNSMNAAQDEIRTQCCAAESNIPLSDDQSFRIVGEIFDTYIVVEKGREIYLIDKHAAHERFIYESIRGTFGDSSAQLLIEPVIVTLTRDETAVFLKNREYLNEAGFLTDEFGDNTVIVREVPVNLDQEDIRNLLCEILGELSKNRNEVRLEIMDKIIATVACKAAVKAGRKSSAQEMRYMIQKLFENTDIKYCPHGRPVAVVLTRYGIEKQFGRIV